MILLKCQYLHARYEFLPKLWGQNGDVGLPSAAHPGCLKDLTSQLLLQRVPDPQRSSCLLFHSCRNILKQSPFPERVHLFLSHSSPLSLQGEPGARGLPGSAVSWSMFLCLWDA